MTGGYRVAPIAEADLDLIWEYIAADDPAAATRLVGEIVARFNMLARQPLIGTARDDLRRGLRDFSHGRYVIYYRPLVGDDIAVEIVRVLHGARDVSQSFPTR